MRKTFRYCDVCVKPTDNLDLQRGFEEICFDCKKLVLQFSQLKGNILKMEEQNTILKYLWGITGAIFGAVAVGMIWWSTVF